jgi:hypothetical protein
VRFLPDPPITADCECGSSLRLEWDEEATCACGRRYSTDGIPEAQYRRVAQTVRRYRLGGYAVGGVLAALMLVVALRAPTMLLLYVPAMMMGWFIYGRPFLRRRYRRAIRAFPQWKLKELRSPRR